MPVMQIRVMRVPVDQARVLVPMGVRLAWRIGRTMRVLMVLVVRMRMIVRGRLVDVLVFVCFGDVQPDTDCHQYGCRGELLRDRLVEDRDTQDCANEGRGREIGTSACGAEVA